MARRHSENAQETTGEAVREFKRDKPRSGSGKVTGRELAVAGEDRKEGPNGPPRAKAERRASPPPHVAPEIGGGEP